MRGSQTTIPVTLPDGTVAVAVPIDALDVNLALYQAARDGDDAMVMECLKNGADASLYHDGCTAIGIAALNQNTDVIIAFDEFYSSTRRSADFLALLNQPQSTVAKIFGFEVPFTRRRYADFAAVVEASYVDETDFNRIYLLGLKDEVGTRAEAEEVAPMAGGGRVGQAVRRVGGPSATASEVGARPVIGGGRGGRET